MNLFTITYSKIKIRHLGASFRGLFSLLFFLALTGSGISPAYGQRGSDPVISDAIINSCQGTILLKVSGGKAPYSYLWKDVNNTVLAETSRYLRQAAGVYTVTVTDSDNKTVSGTYEIATNAQAAVTVIGTPTHILCKGSTGAVSLRFSSGNPYHTQEALSGYSYRWTDETGKEIWDSKDISGLKAGTYTVEITDRLGCKETQSYTLTEPEIALSVSGIEVLSPITCLGGASDGSLKVNVVGGVAPYTYRWEGNHAGKDTDMIWDLSAGVYSVEVTDKHGCVARHSYELIFADRASACGMLSVSTPSLPFSETVVGETATEFFEIKNTGNGDLTIWEITYPEGFSGNWHGGRLSAGATREIAVTFSPMYAGSHLGNIVLMTSEATLLPVSGTGTAQSTSLWSDFTPDPRPINDWGWGDMMFSSKSDSVKLSEQGVELAESLKLYPNPAVERLNVKIPSTLDLPVTIELKDANGQKAHAQHKVKSRHFSLDVSGYKAGIYVLWVHSEERVVSKKVIIQ